MVSYLLGEGLAVTDVSCRRFYQTIVPSSSLKSRNLEYLPSLLVRTYLDEFIGQV